MQFNQTNKNTGDVNNALSEKGNVVQTTGSGSKVQVDHPKEHFWMTLFKKVVSWVKWLFGTSS
jgi:hypothetical protein